MRFRIASILVISSIAIAFGISWFARIERPGVTRSATSAADTGASTTLASATELASVPPTAQTTAEVAGTPVAPEVGAASGNSADVTAGDAPVSKPWDAIVADAVSDRAASRALDYVSIVCQLLLTPRPNTGRFDDARWLDVAKRCPTRLPDVTQRLATSLPARSASLDQLTQALESDDVTRSDELAASILRSSNDSDELEAAVSSYFSPERMRALAGNDRPASLLDPHGALALQIDLTLMVSCSLATDCAPNAPITLAQCASTSLCHPGHSMQQIIAMRRSPEEVLFLQRLLAYVHQMRKHGG